MRISDWSSDVCSSDLAATPVDRRRRPRRCWAARRETTMADGTASETKRQLADKRMGHLKRERANIDPLWRELRDTFMPPRGRFTRDEEKHHKRIALLNETQIFAPRTLASGLHAGLTSPARPRPKPAIRGSLAERRRWHERVRHCHLRGA